MNDKRKHCHNCKHLEFIITDCHYDDGFICNKRNYGTVDEETKHLQQLDKEEYRMKSKKCFEHGAAK